MESGKLRHSAPAHQIGPEGLGLAIAAYSSGKFLVAGAHYPFARIVRYISKGGQMETRAVSLKVGQWVTAIFTVKSAQMRRSKNNDDYLVLELYDSSGTIKGHLWNQLEMAPHIKQGSLVKVRGYVKNFNAVLQIKKIWLASKNEISPSDFSVPQKPVSEEEFQDGAQQSLSLFVSQKHLRMH